MYATSSVFLDRSGRYVSDLCSDVRSGTVICWGSDDDKTNLVLHTIARVTVFVIILHCCEIVLLCLEYVGLGIAGGFLSDLLRIVRDMRNFGMADE